MMRALEAGPQLAYAFHKLSDATIDVNSELCNTRIGQRKLGYAVYCHRELAQAEHPDAKLRNIDDACTELPD